MTVAVTPTSPTARLTALAGPDAAAVLIDPAVKVTAADIVSAREFLDRLPQADDFEIAARIGNSNPRLIAQLRTLFAHADA